MSPSCVLRVQVTFFVTWTSKESAAACDEKARRVTESSDSGDARARHRARWSRMGGTSQRFGSEMVEMRRHSDSEMMSLVREEGCDGGVRGKAVEEGGFLVW